MSDYMTATLVLPTFALDLVAIQEALDREGRPNEKSRASDGTATLIWAEAAYGEVPGVENAWDSVRSPFGRLIRLQRRIPGVSTRHGAVGNL